MRVAGIVGRPLVDEEGLRRAWNFGKNVAWVVKKLKG